MFVFALALIFLPAQAALADNTPIADKPTGVYGRYLPASEAGDTSDWVEIAQNGGYSLIVRKDCLMYLGRVWFADIETDSYQISHVRNLVNNWFKNTLSSTARLRDFTVQHNALQDIGNFTALDYGLSQPSATAVRTGDDVAFLLSFAEAASFCSLQYANPGGTAFTASSALARNNYYMLNKPGQGIMNDFWWLRSPGHSTNQVRTACSVGTHGGIITEGSVYTSSARAEYPYVRPALWVGSGIFGGSPETFTLSYNANGGAGAPSAQTDIPANSSVSISSIIPVRAGYTFAGWATSSTAPAAQYLPGSTILMNGNITLYAVWGNSPSGVDGRILTTDKSGDSVNWVEIARYGNYSLILRSSYINIYVNTGHNNDPAWQFIPFGSTNTYGSSYVRDRINAWFNGTGPAAGDNLPPNARMRLYTMQNNAATTLGSCSSEAALANGFSLPSNIYIPKGDDVSFPLSYSEAANFCSLTHQVRGRVPENQESNDIAKLNYGKITIPPYDAAQNYLYAAWLRSPGDYSHTAGALGGVNGLDRGRAFQNTISPAITNEHGLVYPALWVDSAIFAGSTCTLSYDANGGAGAPAPQPGLAVGASATISTTRPTRPNYTFLGWALSASASEAQYQPGGTIVMTGDITLYAVWTQGVIVTHTLSYNANNGIGAPPALPNIPHNTYATISMTIPTRVNHAFLGWALTSAATAAQYQPGDPIFMDSNKTLYAVWSGLTPTLEGVDGRILTTDKSGDLVNWVEIARYGKYSLIVRSSYLNVYAGSGHYGDYAWQYIDFGSSNAYSTSSLRVRINAWFNGIASVTGDNLPANARLRGFTMQNNAAGLPGTASTEAALTNGFSLPSNTYIPMGNDVSFALSYSEAANFCSITHQVRGRIPEAQESNNIAKLNYAKITIPQQYLYTAWLRSAGDNANTASALSTVLGAEQGRAFQCFVSANASAEKGLVYPALWVDSAVFDNDPVTLSYNANGGSGAPAPHSVPGNSYAIISDTEPIRAGYAFLGWSLSNSASVPQYQPGDTIFMDSDKTLFAVWIRTYTLYYNANGGSGAPPNQADIPENTAVTISATEPQRADYDFLGWATASNATVPEYQPGGQFNIGVGDKTLYAVWERQTYTLSYNANGGSGAPLDQEVPVNTAANISSIIPVFPGHDFRGWALTASATTAQYQPGGTIFMDSDIQLYAVWAPNTRTITGYVWPMATEDIWGIGNSFLSKFDITVELRETFNTPAPASLSVKAVLQNTTGLGKFTFEDVPYGTYVLHIKRPGFLTRALMVTISASDPAIVELSPPDGLFFNLWWGDCNGDGRVDNDDIMRILEMMNLGVNAYHPLYDAACDLNADGLIDNSDILRVLEMWDKTILDYPGMEDVNVFI